MKVISVYDTPLLHAPIEALLSGKQTLFVVEKLAMTNDRCLIFTQIGVNTGVLCDKPMIMSTGHVEGRTAVPLYHGN